MPHWSEQYPHDRPQTSLDIPVEDNSYRQLREAIRRINATADASNYLDHIDIPELEVLLDDAPF